MLHRLALLLVTLVAFGGPARAEGTPPLDRAGPVAFLGLTFIDTSTEGAYNGARADEHARIALLEKEVRDRFAAEGFTLMELDPIAAQLEGTVNPANCYGCDVRMAAKLGADYVLVGEVQKVSNLILSMNLVMREVPGGAMVRGKSVDIRSNTDASWLRGIRYLMNHYFFAQE